MEYNKILPVLKRCSFDEKMLLCKQASITVMDISGIEENLYDKILPWEYRSIFTFFC